MQVTLALEPREGLEHFRRGLEQLGLAIGGIPEGPRPRAVFEIDALYLATLLRVEHRVRDLDRVGCGYPREPLGCRSLKSALLVLLGHSEAPIFRESTAAVECNGHGPSRSSPGFSLPGTRS